MCCAYVQTHKKHTFESIIFEFLKITIKKKKTSLEILSTKMIEMISEV